ncbi:MAG: TIGR04149 family rSAM-modified RiPP [Bacteroidales bacterium]
MKNTLKLNKLNFPSLSNKKLSQIRGGNCCGCACKSVSTTDNGYANRDLGVDSPGDMKDLTYYLDDVVVPGTGNKPGNGMILPGATTTEMSGIITKG